MNNRFSLIWLAQIVLIAIFPAVHMASCSGREVTVLHLLFAIGLLTSISLLLFFIASFLYRSYAKGALATNAFWLFLYGIKIAIDRLFIPLSKAFWLFRVRYAFTGSVFLLLYVFFRIYKTDGWNKFCLRVLVLPFFFLNLYSVYRFSSTKIALSRATERHVAKNRGFRESLLHAAEKVKHKHKPDIYFIILDWYTSNNVLFKIFAYDNSVFTRQLSALGMNVAYDAKSNYPFTKPSMAATLNLQYLSDDKLLPYERMAEDNNVKEFVEALGYTYFDLSPSNDDLAFFWDDDYFMSKEREKSVWGEFKKFLLGQLYFMHTFVREKTPLYPFVMGIYEDLRRDSLLKKFELLENIIEQKPPKFVYAHFFLPHPPYSFDEHGNPYRIGSFKRSAQSETEWLANGFIHSIKFANKKIYSILKRIINESKDRPVIILQSDHGIDFPKKECLEILSACYAKDGVPTPNSSINNFRIIFNHYFDTNFPLLDYRSVLRR